MKHDIPIRLEGHIIHLSQIKGLESVSQWQAYASLPTYAQEVINFCHQWLSGINIFFQQTSGSTGQPKQIEITREQMTASADMTAQALGLQAGDQALLCLSAAYIAGKMMLVRAMETGMALWAVSPSSQPLAHVREVIDFMAVVPLQMKSLLDSSDERIFHQLNQMKAIIIGGAPVSPKLEEEIECKLSCPVYSTYGMTETVSHVALRRLNGKSKSDLYQILPGVEAQRDHRGCLMLRGAVTQHQWLTTNDVVEMRDGQYFRWKGRADHVINSGGVKIHTEELEKKLEEGMQFLGSQRPYFVAGLEDEKLGQKVCLFVEGSPASPAQLQKLQLWWQERLSAYERPKQVFFTPRFAYTPTGKILREESVQFIASGQ